MDNGKRGASRQGGKSESWWNRFLKRLAEAQKKSSGKGCRS